MSAVGCGNYLDAVLEDSTEKFYKHVVPEGEAALDVIESEFGIMTSDVRDVASGVMLEWFDALGLGLFVNQCDETNAKRLYAFARRYNPKHCPRYQVWTTFKDLDCPKTHTVLKEQAKIGIRNIMKGLPQTSAHLPEVESYLLDDVCGHELWEFLVDKAQFPSKMVDSMDRQTIVQSPFFPYLLEVCGRKTKRRKDPPPYYQKGGDDDEGSKAHKQVTADP